MASALLPTFCLLGPLSTLQLYHGREIIGHALDSTMMAQDNDKTFIFTSLHNVARVQDGLMITAQGIPY